MTAPRQVLAGKTYLVTRRCADRRFFLKPSRRTNAVFRYVLAVAANKYEVEVHAACVLSNHYHLVVTDPHARLPAFGQYLNSLLARALNATHGRWEHFWAPSPYSAVALETPDAVIEKIAYALANPVAGGLVRHARKWPGVWVGPDAVGRSLLAERPKKFFQENGEMPAEAHLELTVPRQFGSREDFLDSVRTALKAQEELARANVKSFLGVRAVLAQKRDDRPDSHEPRRKTNPRIATRDKWKRIEALARLQTFLDAYREAREKLIQGVEAVIFPAGTYLLRVVYSVECASP